MRTLPAAAFAALSIAMLVVVRAPAQPAQPAKNTIASVEGPIVEITSQDITIKTRERPRAGFRLPASAGIFYADGVTRYQRAALHPGLRIRIFYDWQLLTYVVVAHHVIVLTPPPERPLRN
jgi:hypothetical protein